MTEDQLSSLLRTLKRHEQPPPGYFEELLRDVHRRQRAELLRQPLWRIAFERVQTFFGEHSMSGTAYAGAMAVVLVTGITAIGIATPPSQQSGGHLMAAAAPSPATPPAPVADRLLRLQTGGASERVVSTYSSAPRADFQRNESVPVLSQPRYVIDPRPVSYERASSSISF